MTTREDFDTALQEAAASVEGGDVYFNLCVTPPDPPANASPARKEPFSFIIASDEVTAIKGGYLIIGGLSREHLEALRDGCNDLLAETQLQ